MFPSFQAPLRRLSPHRFATRVTVACVVLAGAVTAGTGWMLHEARRAAWHAAEQSAQNLVLGLGHELERTTEGFDLSLRAVVAAAQRPELSRLAPDIRQAVLFDGAIAAEAFGGVVVADETGQVVHDSASAVPRPINVADRDYFQVHRERPDAGLVVSRPLRNRGDGRPSIGFARRVNRPDGSFAGVAVGALRLDHVRALFDAAKLGERDSVSLFSTEGRLVARRSHDEDRVGRDVGGAPLFLHLADAPAGTFEGVGVVDGVRRLYAYKRIGPLPLVLAVGLSEGDIYASWTRTALAVGAALLSVLALAAGLALVLRREFRRNADLERRAAQEAAKLVQLQKMEGIGRLTGGIAHDFNNLLAVVLGNLELLRKRLPADDARALRLLDNTVHGARRGAALTQRMLAFARKQDLKPEPVGVPDLVSGMADLLARSIGPQVKIETRFSVGLPRAMVDAHQLEMAVLNLAVNARDAMPEGGTLAVEVDEVDVGTGDTLAPGAYVRLRVSDTGAGMDAATLARATEPFFTTKGVGKGTGLGLPMVHGLAHQSGGRFCLDSEPGRGTTAEILLPAVPASALPAPAAPTSPPARAGGDGGPRGRGLTVLVVDDDALVRDSTAAMLDELGHAAVEAESARQALDILRAGRAFDAVVTDHSMPGMSGARLAAVIEAEWPGLPVVLASGYAELPEDALGAVAERLTKPFQPGDLASALARATGSGGSGDVVPLRGQGTGRTRASA